LQPVPPGPSLTVTSQLKVKASSQLVATQNETVLTLGTCSIISGGNPGPCVPTLTTGWLPVSVKNKCSGKQCLLASSKWVCGIGGTVSVAVPGQTKVSGL